MRSLIYGTELRRFARSPLSRAALVVVCLIPLLYGALYLWAFWDPTGHLDRMPVALVVADTGATDPDGRPVDAGRQVADSLLEAGTLDWHEVKADQAAKGLQSGDYFAVVTLPADFSASVVSAGGDDPTAADLQVTYNDANGYTARSVLASVLREVRAAVSATLGEQLVDTMLVGFTTLHDQLGTAADGAGQLAAGAADATRGSAQLTDGAGRLADGATELADGVHQAATGAQTLADGTAQLDSGAAAAADGAARLSTGLATLSEATSTLPEDTTRLADGARQVADGNARIAGVVGAAAPAVTDATDRVDAAAGSLTALRDAAIGPLSDYVASNPQDTAAADLLARLQDGRLDAAVTDLTTATGTLRQATDTAVTQTQALATGADQVADGAEQLAAAAPALHSGIDSAAEGSAALAEGTSQLADGTHQAATGAATLADGLARLDTGAAQLATGASDLADGSARLGSGLARLRDGAEQLSNGLADGADQTPSYTDSERAQAREVLADPVQLVTGFAHRAAGNGEGFTPYFSGLALYVGAMIAWMVLRPVAPRAMTAPVSSARVVLAGYAPALLIGAVQAGLLLTVLVTVLGLRPHHLAATVALMVLVSAAYLALQQAIAIAFGPAGRVLVLVLLMLQLTSAGGTYPAELTPQFFQTLHRLLPMTHVVDGLRDSITGDLTRYLGSLSYLLMLTVASLLAGVLAASRNRVWTIRRLHPEFSL